MSRPRGACRRSIRFLFGLGLGMAMAGGQANGPAPSYVAGDLIVKFKETSQFGQQLALAARGLDKPDEKLTAVATPLSAALGIALAAVRVTSGRELVLSVDRAALRQTLIRQLTRDPAVRAVLPIESPQGALPAVRMELEVQLTADSKAQRLVRQAAQSGHRTTPEIDALVAQLAAGSPWLPDARVDDQGRLMLTVDVARLTRELVVRLQARPDVEYAQVNLLVKPYGEY